MLFLLKYIVYGCLPHSITSWSGSTIFELHNHIVHREFPGQMEHCWNGCHSQCEWKHQLSACPFQSFHVGLDDNHTHLNSDNKILLCSIARTGFLKVFEEFIVSYIHNSAPINKIFIWKVSTSRKYTVKPVQFIERLLNYLPFESLTCTALRYLNPTTSSNSAMVLLYPDSVLRS